MTYKQTQIMLTAFEMDKVSALLVRESRRVKYMLNGGKRVDESKLFGLMKRLDELTEEYWQLTR